MHTACNSQEQSTLQQQPDSSQVYWPRPFYRILVEKKLKIWQNTSCQLPVYSSMFILSYAISQTSNTAKAIRVNTEQFNTFTEDKRFENKEMIA